MKKSEEHQRNIRQSNVNSRLLLLVPFGASLLFSCYMHKKADEALA